MKGIAYEVSIDASTYTSPPFSWLIGSLNGRCARSATISPPTRRCPEAGAMGAALAAMVARISFKKEKSEELKSYIEETENLRADFLRLVDDDSAAYARVAEAMKLPRKTEEEKKERQDRMQAALLAASRVPLEVAETARRLLDACERGVASASPMTASDIGVGALMAETALRGAALNVMINLASVKDAAQVKAISEHLDRAVDGSDEQRRRITDFVESRIAR